MLLPETIFGLGIMAMVLTVLLLSIAQQRTGQRALSEQREATRIAERALLALRVGEAMPSDTDASIDITQAMPGDAPPGKRWVRVTVQYRERSTSLVGLAPATAAEVAP